MLFFVCVYNRGNPDPILASRTEATVILAEVGITESPRTDELSVVVNHCQRQKRGVRLAIWGTPEAINKVHTHVLAELMSVGGPLQGYQTRTIMVFLSKDDPLPFRPTYSTNVTRAVLLVSPNPFKKGPDFMVSQSTWTPSLIVHLVSLLDMYMNALFVL